MSDVPSGPFWTFAEPNGWYEEEIVDFTLAAKSVELTKEATFAFSCWNGAM